MKITPKIKKFIYIGIFAILITGVILTIHYVTTSCSTTEYDPCKNIVCGDNGRCSDGKCEYKYYKCTNEGCKDKWAVGCNKNEYRTKSECEEHCLKIGDTVKVKNGESGCLMLIDKKNNLANVCQGPIERNRCPTFSTVNYTDIKKIDDKKIPCKDNTPNCEGVPYACKTYEQVPTFKTKQACKEWLDNNNDEVKWGKCIDVSSPFEEQWTIGCDKDEDCHIGGDKSRKCLDIGDPNYKNRKSCSCNTKSDCTLSDSVDLERLLCSPVGLGKMSCPSSYQDLNK